MSQAAVFSAAFSVCAIHFSPAVSSVLLLIALLTALFLDDFKQIPVFAFMLGMLVIWQLLVQSGPGWQNTSSKWLLRLPLILLPFSARQWNFSGQTGNRLLVFICLFHAWISGASVLQYLSKYRFYNQMVLESKPLPVFSSVYHIEFSLILAVITLIGVFLIWNRQVSHSLKLILIVSTALNLLFLHLLSARTGMLAFWSGMVVIIFLQIRQKGALIILLSSIALVFTIITFALPTVRNRIVNTLEDATAVIQGGDLNHKSFGQRWVAWGTCIQAIKNKPFTGYGIESVDKALESVYLKQKSSLDRSNWIMPHNQILDLAVQSGVPAAIIFLLFYILAAINALKRRAVLLLAMLTALFLAGNFESILERQAGVLILLFAVSVSSCYPFTEKIQKNP